MEPRAVFLDVDGTVVAEGDHVPDSTLEALRVARRNGHRLFLASGRTRTEIHDFLDDLGFEGFICAGGAFAEVDGELVLSRWRPNWSTTSTRSSPGSASSSTCSPSTTCRPAPASTTASPGSSPPRPTGDLPSLLRSSWPATSPGTSSTEARSSAMASGKRHSSASETRRCLR
ncbi:HAD hydrolase family protein [Tessaracoccus palaemonis]|uniref:HAD hydrolase family protein n=1 Tax=Tessaracoccus palaemonis TaxID=2829499 RepID=A0ABX8SGL8_9ACTN|nr:HAD hydrolase family protein [Tessaracoccus palaemonis]